MSISTLLRNFPLSRRLTRDEATGLIGLDDHRPAACRRRPAARRRARPHVVLFAQGVHPAHAALPRRLPLLHVRARAARRRTALSFDRRRCWPSREAGREAGCKEALFTLGDKPELRYRAAREELDRLGHATTLSYLAAGGERGVSRNRTAAARQSRPDDRRRHRCACARSRCRRASCWKARRSACGDKGGAHYGSPDKVPAARLETMRLAGERNVPFTSGILIGIGETRAGAHRGAAGAARSQRRPRPHPGNHHPEFPAQARHADGSMRPRPTSTSISGRSRWRG